MSKPSTETTPTDVQLVDAILQLARNGVYREQIMFQFRDSYAPRAISRAIATAKRQGLYSVSELRHTRQGTYYEYEFAT